MRTASDDPGRDRERHGILRTWLRYEHGVTVSVSDAAAALAEADAASPSTEVEVAGRDLVTGLSRTVVVRSDALVAAAEQPPLPW